MALSTTPYGASAMGGIWLVTYREPSGTLDLSFEMGIDKPILWVPTESEWVEKMPDWAQGRRDEIIDRVVECAFGPNGAHRETL